MRATPNGVAVIKYFESCDLKAYPDPKTGGAPWTIGWGATGPGIGPGVVWTQQQADDRLMKDIGQREALVLAVVSVPLMPGQFDAFVSALFNIGPGGPTKDGLVRLRSGTPSTFLRLLNAADYAGARKALGAWVSPGSSVEKGLRRRRLAEQALWDGQTAAEAIATASAL